MSRLGQHRSILLGFAGLAVLLAIEVSAPGRLIPIVFYVVAPVAVALHGTPRGTAAVGAAAVVMALVISSLYEDEVNARLVLALAAVPLGAALAVWLATLLRRAEEQALRLQALSEAERQLTSALGVLGDAVSITDASGRMLYVNDAAVELLRAGSADELIGAPPDEIMGRFAVYDERGAPVGLDQLPGSRLLAGEADPPPLLVRNVVKATGEERWLLNKASLVPGGGGARVVNVIEDLSVLKRAELRQRLLAEATRELAASLDYAQTLQRVAEVVVPELADWCSVSMPGRGAEIAAVALAHSDPARVRAGRELDERYPSRIDDDTDLAAILRGEPGPRVLVVPRGAVEAFAHDADHLQLLEDVGFGSILIVPLDAGGQRLGAMVLVRSDPLRRFSPNDVVLAEDVAARAANAVLNARLYTERAELADTLQRGMLPPQLPVLEAWSAAALYHPAGEIGEVGGDFFDVFRAGDDWIAVIGDVTGHGPDAATLTAHARHTLRTAAELTGDPVAAIAHLNRSLRDQTRFGLCTAACVRLSAGSDPPTASIASAGHPLPLLVRDGAHEEVGRAGPLVGAFDDVDWPLEVVPLRVGDALVLYTDGVVDALSHRGRRGEAWMHALIAATPVTADRIIRRLDAALAAEPEERRRDDTAAVALQLLAAPVPAAPG
jgi:serine phosphatase RsbU (regulator of sigma subunit)/PAS domain-containing protein